MRLSLHDFVTFATQRKRLQKLSQRESQKFPYLHCVIVALEANPQHVRALIASTQLSPKSVIGSLRLLRDRGVITRSIQGTKHVYHVDPYRAKRYLLNGITWRLRRRYPKYWRTLVSALHEFSTSHQDPSPTPPSQRFTLPKTLFTMDAPGEFDLMKHPHLVPPGYIEMLQEYTTEYEQLKPYLDDIKLQTPHNDPRTERKLLWFDLPAVLQHCRTGDLCFDCLTNGSVCDDIAKDPTSGIVTCHRCAIVLKEKPMVWNRKPTTIDGSERDTRDRNFKYTRSLARRKRKTRGKPEKSPTTQRGKATSDQTSPERMNGQCPTCGIELEHRKTWHVASHRARGKGFTVYLYYCPICDVNHRAYERYTLPQ